MSSSFLHSMCMYVGMCTCNVRTVNLESFLLKYFEEIFSSKEFLCVKAWIYRNLLYFVSVNFNSRKFVWKICVITFSDKIISWQKFTEGIIAIFHARNSWTKLIFRSMLKCKQKGADSSKLRERRRVNLLAIFHVFKIFVELNFRWKSFGVFAPDENISTRKKPK